MPISNQRAILLALAITLLVAVLRYSLAPSTANDLSWPLCQAREFLSGRDPYGPPCQIKNPATGVLLPPNPLTTTLVAIPFVWMPEAVAAAVMTGLMFGMAAFAILITGTPWRLVSLLSFPAYYCLLFAQWPPLLLAITLIPSLMPLGLVKPQLLIPTFVSQFTWKRSAACIIFFLLTLVPDPSWPLRFWVQTRSYDGYLPMLTAAGPALLLLGLRWRELDARYLLLCGLTPQRLFHDLLIIAPVLRTAQEAFIWTGLSWLITGLALSVAPTLAALISPVCYITAALLVAHRVQLLRWRSANDNTSQI